MLKVFVRKLLMPKNYFSPLKGKSVQKKKKKTSLVSRNIATLARNYT